MQQSQDPMENQPYKQTSSELQEDEIDLRDLWAVILSGKWIICGITLLVLLIGVGYALITHPVYKADALLQVEEQKSTFPELEGMKSLLGGGSSTTQAHIEILKSRSILGQVVDKQNLQIQAEPIYFPLVGQALSRFTQPHPQPRDPFLGLKGYAWGGEDIQIKRLQVPQKLLGKSLILRAEKHHAFVLQGPEGKPLVRGKTHKLVRSETKAGKVEIFVSSLIARPGTQFRVVKWPRLARIQNLRGHLSMQPKGSNTAGGGTGIIGISLTGKDPEQIKDILNTLTTVYLRQNVKYQSAQAEERLKFLNKQLPDLQKGLQTAESRLSQFQQEHTVMDLSEKAKSLLKRMVEVDNQLTKLSLKESELEQKYNPQHPALQALREKKDKLQKQNARLQSRMKQLPKTQQKLLGLKRKYKVQTKLYTSLLNTAQQIKLVKAGTIGNVRIVDHAAVLPNPIKPKKMLIAAISLILGLFLGTGVVFLRRALNPAIHDPEGLESKLGYPVYAVLPHSSEESKLYRKARRHKQPLPVLSQVSPQDLSVESMRSLRTSLQFALAGTESKCVCFTATGPEGGKSFLSVNMAYLLAQTGQKVLIIDSDLRKGKFHSYTGEDKAPGLSEYLAGRSEVEDILHPASQEGPAYIFTGTRPPNPAELLTSERLPELLQWASEHYDRVILDAPPIMVAADTSIIAAHAGAVFLLVRAGMNTEQEIREGIKRLQQNRVQVAGFVFNDLGGRQSDKSYTGRYGGYRYYRYYRYSYK